MSRLHFISGHQHKHQGACGFETVWGKKFAVTEWEYAQSLHLHLDDEIHKYQDAFSFKRYDNYISNTAVALEFHLNSFNSPDIEGYEVLVLAYDNNSKRYAQLFLDIMKHYFPSRRSRGIKLLYPEDRGYNNLLRLKQDYKLAILTEAFFLNNPDDWIPRKRIVEVINCFNQQLNMENLQ